MVHLKSELLALCARVEELVDENYKAKTKTAWSRRSPRFTKQTLREKQLIPLSRRGRQLAREHPDLLPALKVPHKNASVAEVAEAAERIADALTPHLNVLIKARYPRNCLKTLRRDARALRDNADTMHVARGSLGRSNRELTQVLSVARDKIDELDSVLRSLKDYPTYRASWENRNRVQARMGRPSKRRVAARKRSAAKSRKNDEKPPRPPLA